MRISIIVTSLLVVTFLAPFALNQGIHTQGVIGKGTHHRVGMLIPLSGPLAEYGYAVRNGVALARRENPAEFDNIEFLFDDTRYDPKTALSSFSRLAGGGDVSLIFNWGTATSEALAPVAERRRVALIANSQTPSVSEGRQHVIRFINPAPDFSRAILNALRRKGYRRLAVVKAELGYINDLLDGMRANLIEGESLHIIDSVLPSEHDFKSTMVNLSAQEFDALGVFLVSGQVGQFYRQFEASGLRAPTFGSDFFESRDEIALAGPAIEGAVFSNVIVQSDFTNRYKQEFGNDTHIAYASNAYDFALLTARILTQAPLDVKPLELLARYREVKMHQGTSGAFGFNESSRGDKFFAFPVGVRRVESGAVVALERH